MCIELKDTSLCDSGICHKKKQKEEEEERKDKKVVTSIFCHLESYLDIFTIKEKGWALGSIAIRGRALGSIAIRGRALGSIAIRSWALGSIVIRSWALGSIRGWALGTIAIRTLGSLAIRALGRRSITIGTGLWALSRGSPGIAAHTRVPHSFINQFLWYSSVSLDVLLHVVPLDKVPAKR